MSTHKVFPSESIWYSKQRPYLVKSGLDDAAVGSSSLSAAAAAPPESTLAAVTLDSSLTTW